MTVLILLAVYAAETVGVSNTVIIGAGVSRIGIAPLLTRSLLERRTALWARCAGDQLRSAERKTGAPRGAPVHSRHEGWGQLTL